MNRVTSFTVRYPDYPGDFYRVDMVFKDGVHSVGCGETLGKALENLSKAVPA